MHLIIYSTFVIPNLSFIPKTYTKTNKNNQFCGNFIQRDLVAISKIDKIHVFILFSRSVILILMTLSKAAAYV